MSEVPLAVRLTTAPLPPNEVERLEALRRYHILDTPPEKSFDRITNLAARLFDVPIALVSLVDQFRAWFKSCYGFDSREVSREDTICSFALLAEDVLVVPDTKKDSRFACIPAALSEPGLRFYAGATLVTGDGFNLGTLCILDTKPRHDFSAQQRATLADLAAMVVDQLELRLASSQVVQINAALQEASNAVSAATGETFFFSLVQHLTKALGVDSAYISQIVGNDSETLRTIAVCMGGQMADNMEYSLRDTPCHEVIEQGKICCYPRQVQAQFPQANLLREMSIESYIAVPLFDSTGMPLGLLGVMDKKPLENIQLAESLLTIFATRVATELERQQLEAERAQMLVQEQAANRIKDEFLAVLSHELRSPLNPILGWTKLLRTRQFDKEKTDKALETIERNAMLQTRLIEDLLDISRIMQGKISLNVCPVNLKFTIEAALETVRLAAEAKSIDLIFLMSDFGLEDALENSVSIEYDKFYCNPKSKIQNPKFLVSGDASRLQQIVWNLVGNAIKFTPPGGCVEVELSLVENAEFLTQKQKSYAQIQVRDTGKGINPEFIPHVFEYFRQADGSINRRHGGLGLGLAIARHLVEMHGGTIYAESEGEGKGATFTVQLPLMKAQTQTIEPRIPFDDALQLDGLQILVVDDEPDTLELHVFMLQQYGAQAIGATSAAEALQLLKRLNPDVLVSDLGMPNEDGYSLIRRVRALESPQGRAIPAIAVTAYARAEDSTKALEAGFGSHISKPVEPVQLVEAIANLIRIRNNQKLIT